jgi:lipopolysaccharide transport system ATP-binding protein
VLFVSHNMAAIEALCTRCIVLEEGTIRFDGKPDEAIARYVSLISADVANGAEADLTTRERSALHPRPVLRRVGLRGPLLEPTQTIRMGDGLSVIVEVDGLHDMPGAFVGLDLRSDLDQAIATFHGRMKPPRRSRAGRVREEVVFELGALPLMPGRYWFSIGVWDPNRSGLADRVERAIGFDVVPADVYGSGYDVQPREGTVFADFEWEVRPVGNGQSLPVTEDTKVPPTS